MTRIRFACLLSAVLVSSFAVPSSAQDTTNFPVLGEVVRLDPRFDQLIPRDAQIEVVAAGFVWAEGPVWVRDNEGGYLLFSDIPRNSIYKWVEGVGVSLYMKPSGYTGVVDYGSEPGSNGLLLDPQGRLVCCEHGDRRVSLLTKDGGKITLADRYQGKRLNSPNDAVFKSNGDLYFTDPPYGLPQRYDDPRRELDFCGVYRLSPRRVAVVKRSAAGKFSVASQGTEYELTLLTREMTRPNGIAFSPDEKTLYVAQSDPEAAIWRAFEVKPDGTLGKSRVFYDATKAHDPNAENHSFRGLLDGMCVDKDGHIFATGPGGVYVFAPDGKLLGRIDTRERTANCTFGGDGSTLYMTADMYICRIRTNTKGLGW